MESCVWGRISLQRLNENIVLLWLLGEEPEKPAENSMPLHFREELMSPSRQLTIERERDLVETFAFLSASSDDPGKVIAVCVEEYQSTDGLTLRIAANSGDLQPRKEALMRIATVLERAAAKG